MKIILLLALWAVAGMAAAGDSAAFAKIKSLAGTWKGTGAEGGGSGLKFEFEGGSNCSADGMYMGNATFNLVSKDHLKARWGMITAGKETGHVDMDLHRAK